MATRLEASFNSLDLQAKPIRVEIQSLLLIVIVLFLANLTALGQRPPNDQFTNSIVLVGNSVTFSGTLNGATEEVDEPYPYFIFFPQSWQSTVWWSWTATEAAPVTIELLDLSTNLLKLGGINIWQGTNWPFWEVEEFVGLVRFDTGRRPSRSFTPTPGEIYHFQVLGPPSSGDFTLRLTATNAPLFTIQPRSQTVSIGGSVFFGAGVAGIAPFHYQWQFNGTNVEQETGAILSLDSITQAQAGKYAVLVWNNTGTNLSDAADLFVSSTDVQPSLSLSSAPSGTGYALCLTGEIGRSYRIEASTNMVDWLPEKSFPGSFVFYVGQFYSPRIGNGMVFNTNASTSFALPGTSNRNKFLRAVRYAPPNDVCINNLKQLRFAGELWALERKHTSTEAPVPTDIDPYFRNGSPRRCPLGVHIYPLALSGDPQCQTPAHLPVEPDY